MSDDLTWLTDEAKARQRTVIDDIRRMVEVESPSEDLEAVARGAEVVAGIIEERLGRRPEVLVVDGVTHLRLRLGTGPTRVLLLNHQDTVWPVGTLDRIPFSHKDGVLRGPGVFDMLTGVAMSIHACAMLQEAGCDLDGVTIVVTGDEEVGSTTSESLILAEAADARAVLVMEAAAEGALKLARKGTGSYRLEVLGRAAHAGLEPEQGVNAALALGGLLADVAALSDVSRGTTVTPTLTRGGTARNTVPAQAETWVDVRAATRDELERVDAEIRRLQPSVDGARLIVHGQIGRLPFERSASAELFDRATDLAGRLGVPKPTSTEVGGASDGNFTAAAGKRTLDGLGAAGAGAHAEHEHTLADEIPARLALLAALVADGCTGAQREEG
ncbi:M20/M25/M40 family metallo-hydrolase [Ornithinimicrobium pratense]|uniref:M20 family metallopeptidase n=1 Tax=Ornithinimicrobium pratense TaxID=2593973 RepID=A0A5J6V7G2_9MICO|nr:M20/M25/M40 family metallo-hydrolase [Ornithinimicrobium pratense]QFG69497.1 M20 family metallopeptidase [Ornithinimicrobium pratense]